MSYIKNKPQLSVCSMHLFNQRKVTKLVCDTSTRAFILTVVRSIDEYIYKYMYV